MRVTPEIGDEAFNPAQSTQAVCHGGPLHGREFHYTGPNQKITYGTGHYHRTTDIDAQARHRWKWNGPFEP